MAQHLTPNGHQSQTWNYCQCLSTYRDTLEQILWYWPKAREGSLVTGHDYGFPRAGHP